MTQTKYEKKYDIKSLRGQYEIILSGSFEFLTGYNEYRGIIDITIKPLGHSHEIHFIPVAGHLKNESQLEELFDKCKDNIIEVITQDKFGEISLSDIKVA